MVRISAKPSQVSPTPSDAASTEVAQARQHQLRLALAFVAASACMAVTSVQLRAVYGLPRPAAKVVPVSAASDAAAAPAPRLLRALYPGSDEASMRGAQADHHADPGHHHWPEAASDPARRRLGSRKKHNSNAASSATVHVEGGINHIPDRAARVTAFYEKWPPGPVEDYMTVLDDHLPLEALHQEPAVCRVGSKIYLVTGINGTRFGDDGPDPHPLFGTDLTTIYDMKDSSVTFGPRFPFRGNHVVCSASAEGVLHVTGGFRQEAPKDADGNYLEVPAHNRHWIWDTSKPGAGWEQKADMPLYRGGHGCVFLVDGKMYCMGGATSQNGGYKREMMIYDPASDTWALGPSIQRARDHIEPVAFDGGHAIYIVGGRNTLLPQGLAIHPFHFESEPTAEVFDIRTNVWHFVKGLDISRLAMGVSTYARYGPDAENTFLIVGGQKHSTNAGQVMQLVEEFDPVTGFYYCHQPLPHPVFGPATGTYEGKLHVVGGGEWFGMAATRRVMILDLEAAPAPAPCFYRARPVTDEWGRYNRERLPYPPITERESAASKAFAQMTTYVHTHAASAKASPQDATDPNSRAHWDESKIFTGHGTVNAWHEELHLLQKHRALREAWGNAEVEAVV